MCTLLRAQSARRIPDDAAPGAKLLFGLMPATHAATLSAQLSLHCFAFSIILVRRYGELQQPQLGTQMSAIQIPDPQSQEVDAVLAALQRSIPQAVQAVQEAQQWCYSISGGTQLPALLQLADDALAQYVSSLQVVC